MLHSQNHNTVMKTVIFIFHLSSQCGHNIFLRKTLQSVVRDLRLMVSQVRTPSPEMNIGE